jgi:hypothetical protein
MIQTGISASEWIPEQRLVITHITGDVDIAGVEEWDNGLQQTLSKIEDNGRFKILVNLHGFTALDLAAHKRFRTVVPQTLARYGWKTGYVHLFEEEAADMQLTNTRESAASQPFTYIRTRPRSKNIRPCLVQILNAFSPIRSKPSAGSRE